jgi:ferredoxin/flavodoxin---NADP+ reductase
VQPGRNLYMIATGTGLAPFVSLVRGREVFDAFERVILVHSVRAVKELAYREELESRRSGPASDLRGPP